MYGLGRLPAGRKRTELEQKVGIVLSGLACETISADCADLFAAIKVAGDLRGRPISDNDAWIASAAMLLGAVLVTRDAGYAGIDGLRVEDWSK